MSSDPKISIALTCYNTPPRLLRRAVKSLVEQSFKDFQLVILNDAGVSPWHHLEPWLDDKRLVMIDLKENRGPYYAQALVLQATRAEFYKPFDSDDWAEKDHLESLIKAIGEREVVFPTYHRYWDGSKIVGPQHYEKVPVRLYRAKDKHLKDKKGGRWPITHHCAGLYRTEALRAVGGPHPALTSEGDGLYMILCARAYDPVVLDYPTYHRVRRQGSLLTDPKTGPSTEWRKQSSKERKRILAELLGKPVSEWGYYPRMPEGLMDQFQQDLEMMRDRIQ